MIDGCVLYGKHAGVGALLPHLVAYSKPKRRVKAIEVHMEN